jgi:hypothetical protein
MRILLALTAVLLLLGGCADVRSVMLADDSAVISASGTRLDDREKIVQDVLAGAAKITAAHGYRYFVILKAQDTSRAGTMSVPDQTGQRTSQTNLSKPGANYTTYSRNVSYVRPGLDITIRMFREGEIDPKIMGVWNTEGTMGPVVDKSPDPKERPKRPANLRG